MTRENNLLLFAEIFHLITVQLFMPSICQEMLLYIQIAGTCLKVRQYLHLELITASSRNKLPEANDCSLHQTTLRVQLQLILTRKVFVLTVLSPN